MEFFLMDVSSHGKHGNHTEPTEINGIHEKGDRGGGIEWGVCNSGRVRLGVET